jgi:hypothetical protein
MTSPLRVTRMVVLAVGFLIASALVGAPAHAADPSIALRPGGALHARGAAIVVEATLTCPAGMDVAIGVRVTQRRADGSLVRGMGQRPVRCTGAAMTRRIAASSADVRFTGLNSGRPFFAGPAFVSASIGLCDEVTCVNVVSSRTVQLANVTLNAAQFSSTSLAVSLPARATLQAAGAGVLVRMPYRCAAGVTGTFELVLIERTSTAAVTSASDGVVATCSGLNRTGIASFHAEAAPWRPGSAFVVLTGGFCGSQGCLTSYAHRTLTLL